MYNIYNKHAMFALIIIRTIKKIIFNSIMALQKNKTPSSLNISLYL